MDLMFSLHNKCGSLNRRSIVLLKYGSLARFFNFEISRLAHRFLLKIEENVNPWTEKKRFSKIRFENRKNMQSQRVVSVSKSPIFSQVRHILDMDMNREGGSLTPPSHTTVHTFYVLRRFF